MQQGVIDNPRKAGTGVIPYLPLPISGAAAHDERFRHREHSRGTAPAAGEGRRRHPAVPPWRGPQ